MGRRNDSRRRRAPRRRWIGQAAKNVFLAAVRHGARLEDAAEVAGHSLPGFYAARGRDAAFAAAWVEALAVSAARERGEPDGPMLGPDDGSLSVAPNNKRRLQARKMRHVRFGPERRATFLAHFAGTCDMTAAAEAAGVHETTVYKYRQRHPEFADDCERVLRQGYVRLEAEALRQRLEAQRKLRDGLIPAGEIADEFERVMKLLARWDRRNGPAGTRSIGHGRQRSMTFEEAMEALEKKLMGLGYKAGGDEAA